MDYERIQPVSQAIVDLAARAQETYAARLVAVEFDREIEDHRQLQFITVAGNVTVKGGALDDVYARSNDELHNKVRELQARVADLAHEDKRKAEEIRLADEELSRLKAANTTLRKNNETLRAERDAAIARERLNELKAQKLSRLRTLIMGPDDADAEDW